MGLRKAERFWSRYLVRLVGSMGMELRIALIPPAEMKAARSMSRRDERSASSRS